MAGDLYVSNGALVDEQGNDVDLTINGALTVTGPASVGPAATSELAYTKITADQGSIALTAGLGIVLSPALTVVVPNLATPVHLYAFGAVSHSVAGTLAVGIAPSGSTLITQYVGSVNTIVATPTTQQVAFNVHARLPAGSPGTYGVYFNGPTGNCVVRAQTFAPTEIWVST